jgi:anaerobic selenocysteine-containing dehydrogenase
VVAPPPGVRDDWDILLDLALALQARRADERPPGPGMTLSEVRALGPRRMLDGILRAGPHRLSLEELEGRPHGIDLGALAPRLPERLFTPDRRIRLVPPVLEADLARLDAAIDAGPPASGEGEMLLVGRRQLRSNNSWMHNSQRLVKGPAPCTLLVHPEDAAARGLAQGAEALVRSRVGEIRVPVSVTDEIGRGVVCLPHGWGHGRDGASLRVARVHAGASFNDLADEQRVDPSCGNADFNGVPVTVEAAPRT